jgi:hypothetical protein
VMLFKVIIGIFFATGLYLAFTAWLGASFHQAPTPQTNQSDQETKPIENELRLRMAIKHGFIRQGNFIHDFREEIVAVGTLFIAAFTVILAFATGFLYFATRDLVTGADDTAEKQLRAYIGTYSMETTFYPYQGGGYVFIAHVELRNFGQTPAYDLLIEANAAIDVPDADPFELKNTHQKAAGRNIAFRDAGVHVNVSWQIPEADVVAVRDREKNVFCWGTVRYRDAFDKHHYFTFRLVSAQQQVGGNSFVMGVHEKGNDAD